VPGKITGITFQLIDTATPATKDNDRHIGEVGSDKTEYIVYITFIERKDVSDFTF
jgi:hypothetical protein